MIFMKGAFNRKNSDQQHFHTVQLLETKYSMLRNAYVQSVAETT